VSDASCRVSDASCRVSEASCRVSEASCRVSEASCRVSASSSCRCAPRRAPPAPTRPHLPPLPRRRCGAGAAEARSCTRSRAACRRRGSGRSCAPCASCPPLLRLGPPPRHGLLGVSAFLLGGPGALDARPRDDGRRGDAAAARFRAHRPTPKPDGVLSFDLLTNLARSGTSHEADPALTCRRGAAAGR